MVSIILPTYNRAKYIGETIESIQLQTYPHWELIIVDDGSTDNTACIITGINDDRIHYINAGRIGINGKIKNIGIQQATGNFIAFIDSDDLWAPDKLARQVAALDQFPQAGFSLTGGYNFIERNKPVDFFYKKQGLVVEDIFLSLFKSEVAAFTQVLVFRKECLETVKGFKEDNEFTDVEFIIQLADHYKAVILYEPLVYRRLHVTNHSKANWSKSYQQSIQLFKTYKKECNIPSTVARTALFKIHIHFGEKYLQYKQLRKAILQHLIAWRYRPLSIIPAKKIGKVIWQHFKPAYR